VTFSATVTSGSGLYSFSWIGLLTGCGGSTTTVLCKATGPGIFAVELSATDSNDFTVTSSPLTFTVFSDPVVNLTANREAFDAEQVVTLTASPSLGSGGYFYAWSGLPSGCSGITATIVCSPGLAGNYSVTVKVTDSNGVTSPQTVIHLVVAAPLSVDLSATPDSPTAGQAVTVTSNATGGTGTITYAWAFGDGATGSGATVIHSFGSARDYSVTLWVNDSGGGSVQRALNLTIANSATVFGVSSTVLWPIVGIVLLAVLVVAFVVLRRRRQGRAPSKDPGAAPAPVEDAEPVGASDAGVTQE
jgi:hypothetical protein